MKRSFLTFHTSQGYIEDWLVLGPCDRAIEALPGAHETELAFRSRLLAELDRAQPDFGAPMELDRYECGANTLFWDVQHCEPDHLLDWSGHSGAYTHRRAWAFTIIGASSAQSAGLVITTTCPATVWLNGRLVGESEFLVDLADQTPHTFRLPISLKTRDNTLLIRFDQIAKGDAALTAAVRIEGITDKQTRIKVPTVSQNGSERLAMERALQFAYMDRAVYTRDDAVVLISPDDTPGAFQTTMRVQTPDGWIYGESYGSVSSGTQIRNAAAVQLPSRPMQAFLMPPPTVYYDQGMRADRRLAFWVAHRPFSQTLEAAGEERVVDALREAARGDDLWAEYAQMAANWWDTVNWKSVTAAIDRVKRSDAGCLVDLVALIGMRARMGENERFPAETLAAVDDAITGFDYRESEQEAGTPAMPETAADLAAQSSPLRPAAAAHTPRPEHEQLLLQACRTLAGQLHPKKRFASGLTGQRERERGEELTLKGLRERGQTGFGAWNAYTEEIVVALSHLVDIATNEQIADIAAVLLDKTLFRIAVQSLRGTFGGSRGAAEPVQLRSGRLTPEAGIGRLLWGLGGYQHGLRGAVSLVLAGESYALPPIISAIANDFEPELWAHERLRSDTADASGAPASVEVNLATYRTADFMLSSAQDFRPGQRGRREHIWQATLGPEGLVFTNHPTSFSESASLEAGWWRGNGCLPRVAQWKDALIALYDLPADAWLHFTHAYFPGFAFAEQSIAGGWACARTEDAYIALYAARGFELQKFGPDAYRELRSYGLQNVWLCQMGSRDTDSSFENFCERVRASAVTIEGLRVAWETIRGERLEFGWSDPLQRNGAVEPITGFKHHESSYAVAEFPAETMDIGFGEEVMRLHFA